jgi:hypothetical protein
MITRHSSSGASNWKTFARIIVRTYQEHDSEIIRPETEDACAMIIG